MKPRILIIEDDETNVEILMEILQDDYTLHVSFSGEEGLDNICSFAPDIVLLDVMMPGMNGYEVCRHIRQNPQLAFIKVILVSAKAMLNERLEGYEAGADDYITKPFDHSELIAKLQVFQRLKYAEEMNKVK
ncbi:MAG: hypothetical protein COB67_11835 [SAR324 cluster bacterium]|uniref:Response regulatory domain-containing protein n=1 Tax=SAR324 cluster bacterium TaxID=2024889 RepID=A0A2A4SST9_9DELT|nr:MAG: hypothetical protein COB67_11835 [SAR324 cluster bacterium]